MLSSAPTIHYASKLSNVVGVSEGFRSRLVSRSSRGSSANQSKLAQTYRVKGLLSRTGSGKMIDSRHIARSAAGGNKYSTLTLSQVSLGLIAIRVGEFGLFLSEGSDCTVM